MLLITAARRCLLRTQHVSSHLVLGRSSAWWVTCPAAGTATPNSTSAACNDGHKHCVRLMSLSQLPCANAISFGVLAAVESGTDERADAVLAPGLAGMHSS
jgi:hypothetical protein